MKATRRSGARGKLLSTDQAARWARAIRARGGRLVFTNGCFDLLHVGHVRYLERARRLGDALIVGLNRDRSVRRLKGAGRPLVPEGDRAEVLGALGCVDAVVLFGSSTPERLIRRLTPQVLVKGADWAVSEIAGADWVAAHGGKVVRIRVVPGRSTTGLIERARREAGGRKGGR